MVTGSNPVGIANKSLILRGCFRPVSGVSVDLLPRRHGAALAARRDPREPGAWLRVAWHAQEDRLRRRAVSGCRFLGSDNADGTFRVHGDSGGGRPARRT